MEELTSDECFWYWAKLPTIKKAIGGRRLFALELSAGVGIVTQEFARWGWEVLTDHVDIMNIQFKDIGGVPDFIFASPRCFTNSVMAGENDKIANAMYSKLMYIMEWAKTYNPHVIFVIDNPPKGLLQKMRLMQEKVMFLGIKGVHVNFCQWGGMEKETTVLLTNSEELPGIVGNCPFFGSSHAVSPREDSEASSEIPQALAEEIAECVHTYFYRMKIRNQPAVELSPENIKKFDGDLELIENGKDISG
mmetsp:Transcript_22366/g.36096  ORF Transcript_22366/g.36096 Transcript_22366/m.36096 type:complete len:249 (-) Transcript_22366:355-1101(-)